MGKNKIVADIIKRFGCDAGDDMLADHVQHRGCKMPGSAHARKAVFAVDNYRFCSHIVLSCPSGEWACLPTVVFMVGLALSCIRHLAKVRDVMTGRDNLIGMG